MFSKYLLWNYLNLTTWLHIKHVLIIVALLLQQAFIIVFKILPPAGVFIKEYIVGVLKIFKISIEWFLHLLWVLYCSCYCIILLIKKLE